MATYSTISTQRRITGENSRRGATSPHATTSAINAISATRLGSASSPRGPPSSTMTVIAITSPLPMSIAD